LRNASGSFKTLVNSRPWLYLGCDSPNEESFRHTDSSVRVMVPCVIAV
jgi:hypothetical protein